MSTVCTLAYTRKMIIIFFGGRQTDNGHVSLDTLRVCKWYTSLTLSVCVCVCVASSKFICANINIFALRGWKFRISVVHFFHRHTFTFTLTFYFMLIGFNYGNLNETTRYRDRVGVYARRRRRQRKKINMYLIWNSIRKHIGVHKLCAFDTQKNHAFDGSSSSSSTNNKNEDTRRETLRTGTTWLHVQTN